MEVGRICVRGAVLRPSIRERVRAPGPVNEEMGARARGMKNRLVADGRFASKPIPSEVQWRLNALLPASGYSAYQPVCGPNPADLFRVGGGDEDLLFARDTSLSGQLVQQWKWRAMAQEAGWKKVAKSKLIASWRATSRLIAQMRMWAIPSSFLELRVAKA